MHDSACCINYRKICAKVKEAEPRGNKQMTKEELKEFLDEKYLKYNNPAFIESDPISIPHQFTKKEDIEIAGFLAAVIAWGIRATIIKNANKLMSWMDNSPH